MTRMREGLRDTPRRVVNAYGDWFSGYAHRSGSVLTAHLEEVEGYDEMVVLRDISFESFLRASHGTHYRPRACRFTCPPIASSASASSRGSSTVTRAAFRCRRSSPRKLPRASTTSLKPRGVGVVIDAVHQCMTTRGVHKRGVSMITSKMLGTFRVDASTARGVFALHRYRRPFPALISFAGARRRCVPHQVDRKAVFVLLAGLQRTDSDHLARNFLAALVVIAITTTYSQLSSRTVCDESFLRCASPTSAPPAVPNWRN